MEARLFRLVLGFIVAMLVVTVLSFVTLSRLKVNGPVYAGVAEQKDLLADILPPPVYLVESYMTVLQMVGESDSAALKEDADKLVSLKKDFDGRTEFWSKQLADSPVRRAILEDSHKPATAFFETLEGEFIPAIQKQDKAAARAIAYGKLKTEYLEHRKAIDQAVGLATENGKKIELAAAQEIRWRTGILVGTLVGAVLLLGLGGYRTSRSLMRAVRSTADKLSDGSNQVGNSAEQVSTASQTLAEGSSEQAASLEETSSALEELASMTKRNSENASKADELAKEARSAADKGMGDMQAMSSAMKAIKASSDDIANIIKTIDEIAFQTNILALNAAVEAARAGEAGMGFAVVAEEVRNLAQRSALAAKETAGKIEGAISKTGLGVQISNQVSETLNLIVTKVRQVDELIAEVASASREQTEGLTQINTAVSQMDKVTQSNAASAEESAAAAEELNSQGVTMKESVNELLHLVGRNGQNSAHTIEVRIPRVSPSTSDARDRQPQVPAEAPSTHWANKSTTQTETAPRKWIEWQEGPMATGFESIDTQHRELIDRINELHDACVAGTAREELLKMLVFLGDYADSHFKHEEGLMEKHRCPVSRKNKAAHAQFLADYQEVVEMVKRDGATTGAVLKLKEMLGNWLTKHICTVDTNMRRCASGARSEQAHAALT